MKKLLFALLALASVAHADNNALLEALVRKKILTQKEADEIQAEMVEEAKQTDAGKIRLSKGVSELALSGDLRFRYQYDNRDPQLASESETQRSRWRFRLRLNADFKLGDNWFGGVQLQTNNQSDSGFQTYGGGFRNYDIFISRAFVGWKAADWATLIIGKQANPFFTTDLLWDPDINPSGVVEQVRFHELFPERKETADGKAAALAARPRPWELTLVAGQFIFSDNSDIRLPNAYLFEQQLIFRYKFENEVKMTVAPAFLTYNPAKVTGALNTQPFTRETDGLPDSVAETANLSLLQLPGDVTFKVADLDLKIVWDAVYNASGGKRVRDTYGVADHQPQDDFAWLLGIQAGSNQKKGDWSLYLNYREIGLGAIDPNLNDSDWGLSFLNLRGFKGSFAYNFTDNVLGAFTYSAAWNLRKNLTGGQATGGARLANANAVQVLQAELNVKF